MADWDDDIASMDLTNGEKNGLQVFRNYQRAFEDYREKELSASISREDYDTADLTRVVSLVCSEDLRSIPVIACAFADDLLGAMFRTALPDGVIGGKSSLFGSYGPLSSFFHRGQLSQVFALISSDLAETLNVLRKERNKISHTWDLSKLDNAFFDQELIRKFPVNDVLGVAIGSIDDIESDRDASVIFRLNVIWLLSRLFYETICFHRAKSARLDPHKVLYGSNHPKLLNTVSSVAIAASKKLLSTDK